MKLKLFRLSRSTAFGISLVMSACCAVAAPGHTTENAPASASALICPVTGTKIASVSKAYNRETYKGKTYYFCCPECKPRFDKNRAKIAANAAKGKYEKM